MKKSNKAFTLIELLVVILIISILAAVAVPQYQKAVYKSQAAEMISLVTALGKAQEAYYLANGEYASSLDQLDVSVTAPKGTVIEDAWTLTNTALPWAGSINIRSTKGPYKDTGFAYVPQHRDYAVSVSFMNAFKGLQIVCVETAGYFNYNGHGTYCTKLLNGTFVGDAAKFFYRLP